MWGEGGRGKGREDGKGSVGERKRGLGEEEGGGKKKGALGALDSSPPCS